MAISDMIQLLVIGNGGREHALAWKLSQSPRVRRIFVAPGNAGTALEPKLQNISISEIAELIEFVQKEQIDITIVGPEVPLAAGIVDAFQAANLKIFGPTQQAARLETSKIFAKEFMLRHNIPTASYQSFNDPVLAHQYIEQHSAPLVIKADGLAAGKGVIVALTNEQAHTAVNTILVEKHLGGAGNEIVIEGFLEGTEVSFIVMTDGKHILPLATSQDHKRLYDNNQGPNTGGMGAYSPTPFVSPELHAKIIRDIIQPVISGLHAESINYCGFLYAGLIITENDQAKVLEFNCRMGDPETEVVIPRIESDLLDLLEGVATQTLDKKSFSVTSQTATTVVLVSGGYPEDYEKGKVVTGLDKTEGSHVFHAGTKQEGDKVQTSGGRVFAVTSFGNSIKEAVTTSFSNAEKISYDKKYYRRDIGKDLMEWNGY